MFFFSHAAESYFLELSSQKISLALFVLPAQQELCDIRKTLKWSKHSSAALLVLESLCGIKTRKKR